LFFAYLLCCGPMLTSGTRGAYVLVPVTLILFAILKFNKRVLQLAVVGAVVIVGLILCLHQTLHCTGSSRPLSLRTTLLLTCVKPTKNGYRPIFGRTPWAVASVPRVHGVCALHQIHFWPVSARQWLCACGRGAWLDWPLYFLPARFCYT